MNVCVLNAGIVRFCLTSPRWTGEASGGVVGSVFYGVQGCQCGDFDDSRLASDNFHQKEKYDKCSRSAEGPGAQSNRENLRAAKLVEPVENLTAAPI
jgi:hypothetical protein